MREEKKYQKQPRNINIIKEHRQVRRTAAEDELTNRNARKIRNRQILAGIARRVQDNEIRAGTIEETEKDRIERTRWRRNTDL